MRTIDIHRPRLNDSTIGTEAKANITCPNRRRRGTDERTKAEKKNGSVNPTVEPQPLA